MNSGFHLAVLNDSALLFSLSGKFRLGDSTRSTRTRLSLYRVNPAGTLRAESFFLENDWVLLPEIGAGFPAHRPYRDEFRQVWDARDDKIVVFSYRSFRVCFFNTDGLLLKVHEVMQSPGSVDDAERRRVLTRAFGTVHDRPLPHIGVTATQLYAGKWPASIPFYVDIVMDDLGRAWALRRESATRLTVDVFDFREGYLGSFEPLLGVLPVRIYGNEALVIDNDALRLARYRVQLP
jgi:hypothetical protein